MTASACARSMRPFRNAFFVNQSIQLGCEEFAAVTSEFAHLSSSGRFLIAFRTGRAIGLHRIEDVFGVPAVFLQHDLKRTEVGQRQLIVEDVLFRIAEDEELPAIHMQERYHIPCFLCKILAFVHDHGIEAQLRMPVQKFV